MCRILCVTAFLYWHIGNLVMDATIIVDSAKTAIFIFAQFWHPLIVLLKYVPTFKSRDKLHWNHPST
jgi:hypothetical protein